MAAASRLHRLLAVAPAVLISLAMVPPATAAEAFLTLERSRGSFANGDPIWLLKLVEGSKLVRTWQAASGSICNRSSAPTVRVSALTTAYQVWAASIQQRGIRRLQVLN
jgi:hypothetical protein